jgi:hypothetical protein
MVRPGSRHSFTAEQERRRLEACRASDATTARAVETSVRRRQHITNTGVAVRSRCLGCKCHWVRIAQASISGYTIARITGPVRHPRLVMASTEQLGRALPGSREARKPAEQTSPLSPDADAGHLEVSIRC